MNLGTDESDRPWEWLRELKEQENGYDLLVRASGDRLVAAYRIAVARCRASTHSTPVPTIREVHAALCEIHSHADEEVPSLRMLVVDCETAGLLVSGPFPRSWMS